MTLQAFASSNMFRYETRNNVVAESKCQEVADLCRDLSLMGLERKVARFEEMDHGTGISRLNASAPRRRKKGSFFPQTARTPGW